MPGMVKAKPPATMEPADMMTCVIFASLRLVLPTARNSTSAVMEVKMVGHGREPILRRYTPTMRDDNAADAADHDYRRPTAARADPRGRLVELILFSFVYPLPLRRKSGYGSDA